MANSSRLSSKFTPSDAWGEFNKVSFAIQQALSKVQTSLPVRIVSCTNSGGIEPVGYVDVVPMVHQMAADGTSVPHTTIYNLPYSRIQGGSNAIIIDPQIGDIGVAVFSSRDISKVKKTRSENPPGSLRKYNFSDGMFLFGMLNSAPTQYIQFTDGGIVIHSPTKITVSAPVVQIDASISATVNTALFTVNGPTLLNGSLQQVAGQQGETGTHIDGPLIVTNDVTANGTSLHTHTHGGVQTGSGTTGSPT